LLILKNPNRCKVLLVKNSKKLNKKRKKKKKEKEKEKKKEGRGGCGATPTSTWVAAQPTLTTSGCPTRLVWL
jgi:hypothetical protein